jgi:SLT domain-containing protein
LNEQNKLAQAWDQSTTDRYGTRVFSPGAVWRNGGVIGPVGSENYNRFMQDYGGFLNRYAEGGYVTGPQQAVVGEGGEPEYIIPASKMDGAMQRYSAGMRGSSMIPSNADVTVNYSGSTVDMGGSSYINKGDVTGIVSQAVNQTLTKLQRSSKARLTAGLR